MSDAYGSFDVDDEEDLQLGALEAGGQEVAFFGVGEKTGIIFVNGDLHPDGSASAMLRAKLADVPYVAVNAVRVLFPLDWLRAECMGNQERQWILGNLEKHIRETARGAKV